MAIDLIRAWKDREYRESLPAEALAQIAPNPAGLIELADEDLAAVVGGSEAVAKAQTGTTPLQQCMCVRTVTADSTGGSCYCTC